MMKYEAVIIGGGPVGFMLASELAMAGVGTCVIERLEKPVPHSKALTLHPRTLELLEMRGILERFVSKGVFRLGYELSLHAFAPAVKNRKAA